MVIAGSYSKRFIDSDLAEPTAWTSFTTAGTTVQAPTNYIFYDYRIMRERIGGIANFEWRPSDDVRVYVRNIYNEFTDHEERDQFNIVLVSGAPAPTVLSPTSIRYPNARATRQFRQNNQTQKLYNVSPGAELKFGRAELDLNYTYAHAQEHTPIRDDLEFRSAANQTLTLDLTNSRPLIAAIDPRLYDAANFPLRRIRERREQIDEDLHTVRADLKLAFDEGGQSFVKFGGKYIDRKKDRDNTQTQRDAVGTSTLAQTGAVGATPNDFYDGDYQFGPTIGYQAVLDYYAANPRLIALNAAQTAINNASLDYHIHEKIFAGYGMASLTFGDLNAIGGVRVERTEGRYDAFQLRAAGTSITPLTFDRNYTHVLPSVHINYRPRTDFTLRAAWTNTLGRPNYDATVPTFTEDNAIGTAGNPNLKPYTSMGLDLSAEYYPDAETIFSVGAFYKRLKNPIFTQTILNTSFAGVALTSLSQPQNADRGRLFGIEANAQRRFTFLPAPFDGLGVSANGTYVTSKVRVPGRESEDIPFFGQSDWIANAALFFEKGPFEARLALSYRSAFIANVGNAAQKTTADIYQAGRTTLDARISYKVVKGIEIFGSLANITKAPLTFYQTTSKQIYSRQIYSFNGDFGVSMRF